MTDPLRPFTQAIRSLWSSRARNVADSSRASSGTSATTANEVPARQSRTGETLRTRLRSRLSAIDGQDAKQMREAFVETVLLWELGDRFAPDPGLADVVARVAEQLATDRAVADRLEQLLLQISEKRSSPR